MNRGTVWLIGAVLALAAACAPPPTEPTPLGGGPQNPKELVTSIRVEGVEPQVGQTSQLTALATFADGHTKDVTSEATWRVRSPGISDVSTAGRLSALRVGVQEVTATLRDVSGSKRMLITGPGTYYMVLSEPGDPIGRGEMAANFSLITANMLLQNEVNVKVEHDAGSNLSVVGLLNQAGIANLGDNWDSVFAAPEGQLVSAGAYENTPLWNSVPPTVPTMFIRVGGAQCAQQTGRFVVRAVEYSGGRSLNRLDLSFEQRCDGATGGLRGEVGYKK